MKFLLAGIWLVFFGGSLGLIKHFEGLLKQRDTKGAIGYFTNSQGIVGCRGYGDIKWFAATEQLPIFHGDLIATKEASATNLRFFDGSEIAVKPNSMIRIKKTNKLGGVIELALVSGEAAVKTGKGQIRVAPGQAPLTAGAVRRIKIEVASRTVITSGDGAGATVSYGANGGDEILIAAPEGDVVIEDGGKKRAIKQAVQLKAKPPEMRKRQVLPIAPQEANSLALVDESLQELPRISRTIAPLVVNGDSQEADEDPGQGSGDGQQELAAAAASDTPPADAASAQQASQSESPKSQSLAAKAVGPQATSKAKFKAKFTAKPLPLPISAPAPAAPPKEYSQKDLKDWHGAVTLRLANLTWAKPGTKLGLSKPGNYPYEIQVVNGEQLHYFSSLIAGTQGNYEVTQPIYQPEFKGVGTFALKNGKIIAALKGPFVPSKTLDVIRMILGADTIAKGNATDLVEPVGFQDIKGKSHVFFATKDKAVWLETALIADKEKFDDFLKAYPGILTRSPVEILSQSK